MWVRCWRAVVGVTRPIWSSMRAPSPRRTHSASDHVTDPKQPNEQLQAATLASGTATLAGTGPHLTDPIRDSGYGLFP